MQMTDSCPIICSKLVVKEVWGDRFITEVRDNEGNAPGVTKSPLWGFEHETD
jgi:hypothetical protein